MRWSKRRVRMAALGVLAVALTGVAVGLALPPARYAGQVHHVRLGLSPYFQQGSTMMIDYWIDATAGKVVFAETLVQTNQLQIAINGVLQPPAAPQTFIIALVRQPNGQCGVTYTTLLSGAERDKLLPCASLLALRDPATLRARAVALWRRYGGQHTPTGPTARVAVPAGTQLVPLLTEDRSLSPGEAMQPGTLVLDTRSGQPISISGYERDASPIMTEHILEARLLLSGSLRGDFFDPPLFSLPDRAPHLYNWLHQTLPWHP